MGGVAAFVVNWNNATETLQSVDSLRSFFQGKDIFVVDNGSEESDFGILAAGLGAENLIRSEENLGYPGGANLAIAKILNLEYEKIMSLNNDAIISPESVKMLIDALDDETIGMVAPWIINRENGRIWYAGGKYNSWFGISRHPGKGSKLPENRSVVPKDSEYLCGCCIMFRSSIFKNTGLLDDRFFIYSEDIAHSIKAKSEGWRICTLPSAIVEHGISVSTGDNADKHFSKIRAYYYARNQILLLKWSNSGIKKTIALLSQIVIVAPVNTLRMLLEGTLNHWISYVKGVYHGFIGVHGPMR